MDDVTRREMPRQPISATHLFIISQNDDKIMLFMAIYPPLFHFKAQKYQKSIRDGKISTTPIGE